MIHKRLAILPALLFIVVLSWACGPDQSADSSPGSPAARTQREQSGEAPGGGAPQAAVPSGIPEGGIERWVSDIRDGLEEVMADPSAAGSRVVSLYVGRQEYIEMFYGPGGQITGQDHPKLADAVMTQEARFHELMQLTGSDAPPEEVVAKVEELEGQLDRTLQEARQAGVPLDRGSSAEDGSAAADVEDPTALVGSDGSMQPGGGGAASMPEIRSILAELNEAEDAYRDGDRDAALAGVEHAYLEGFEPLESRLAQSDVQRVERLIHLSLRPRISRGAPQAEVAESFAAVRSGLRAADRSVAEAGSSFWFGAFNSLIIIVREGLEAVLLVGALLAYLATVEGGRRHHSRIWAGVALGVGASFATWGVARTLIPVSGGSRELIEGITALVAVAVLIYVSNWIFQRSYIHHWKDFLREKLDTALGTGSALAMAGLAFAAVYREGFETVLFYQALMFDVGTGAVLAGFVPGLLFIAVVGVAIIRLGLRLPLKQVFAATNAILVYLAFVFTGKGIYNLQEAGLFAPHPVGWMPDSEALRLLFGIYPVGETLAGQALLLAIVGATFLYYRKKTSAKVAEARARTPEGDTASGRTPGHAAAS